MSEDEARLGNRPLTERLQTSAGYLDITENFPVETGTEFVQLMKELLMREPQVPRLPALAIKEPTAENPLNFRVYMLTDWSQKIDHETLLTKLSKRADDILFAFSLETLSFTLPNPSVLQYIEVRRGEKPSAYVTIMNHSDHYAGTTMSPKDHRWFEKVFGKISGLKIVGLY